MTGRSLIVAGAALATAAVLGAALAIGIYLAVTWESTDSATPVTTEAESLPSEDSEAASEAPIADLYEEVSAGVVEITVSGVSREGPFGPFEPPEGAQAQGSGFVIDEEGTILTNQHVVESADSIEVTFEDGTTVDAELLGTDASTDVGVIRVEVPAEELTPLRLGDSSAVRVGEPVVAIGSPFGFEGSITAGIVSAVGRTVRAPNNYSIAGTIQTDAALNSGNSGGPLLNMDGEVVGINAQIESTTGGNVGVGFAVPINSARRAADAIAAGESVTYPYLGTQLADAPSGGAEIAVVEPDSPAADAGLKEGDIVVGLDGEEIGSADDLGAAIAGLAPGDKVTLTIQDNGETREIEVTLGRRPS